MEGNTQKLLKLILFSNLLSPLGICTTVSNLVDIQDSTLNLRRATTVAETEKITIIGASTFNQNDNTFTNNGIIDTAGYNGNVIEISITGSSNEEKVLFSGKVEIPIRFAYRLTRSQQ